MATDTASDTGYYRVSSPSPLRLRAEPNFAAETLLTLSNGDAVISNGAASRGYMPVQTVDGTTKGYVMSRYLIAMGKSEVETYLNATEEDTDDGSETQTAGSD